MNKFIAKFSLLSVLILSMIACGGGGGGRDEGSNPGNSACATLGLNEKIINGTGCEDSNSPVVEISLFDSAGNGFLCSGTMISSVDVVTAAHCFPSAIQSAYIDTNGTRVFATQYAIHPNYTEQSDSLRNDVAILRLERAVSLPTVAILRSRQVQSGDIIEIFGYGKTEAAGIGELRSGEMEVSDVDSDHVTAVFGSEGSNTCQGDSGGPALLVEGGRAGLIGVTSYGSNVDCGPGDQSVFSNLQTDSYFSFIQSVVPSVSSF